MVGRLNTFKLSNVPKKEKVLGLKNAFEDMVFIYEDESRICGYQALHATRSLKEKNKSLHAWTSCHRFVIWRSQHHQW
jgi:hypothetical protein